MTAERLASGMKVSEAVARAEQWWEKTARHMIAGEFNKERQSDKVKVGGGVFGIKVAGEVSDVIPSGILRALPWDMLTRDEKLNVTKAWHHEFVSKANTPTIEQGGGLILPGSNTVS